MLISFTLFMSVFIRLVYSVSEQQQQQHQQEQEKPCTPKIENEHITISYTPTRHRSVTSGNINRNPQSPHPAIRSAREDDYFSLDMSDRPPPPTLATSPHARSLLSKQTHGQRGLPTVRSPSDIYYTPLQNAPTHRILPSTSAASRQIPPFSAPAVVERRDRVTNTITCPFCDVSVSDVSRLQEHLNVHKQ